MRRAIGVIGGVLVLFCIGIVGYHFRWHLLWMMTCGVAEKVGASPMVEVGELKSQEPLEEYKCGEMRVLLPKMSVVEIDEKGTLFALDDLGASLFVGTERFCQTKGVIDNLRQMYEAKSDDFSWSLPPSKVKALYELLRIKEMLPIFPYRILESKDKVMLLRRSRSGDSITLDIEFKNGCAGFAILKAVDGDEITQRHIDYFWHIGKELEIVDAMKSRKMGVKRSPNTGTIPQGVIPRRKPTGCGLMP